jgi:hypothetical protein
MEQREERRGSSMVLYRCRKIVLSMKTFVAALLE